MQAAAAVGEGRHRPTWLSGISCHAATADGFTRPPFAHPEGLPQTTAFRRHLFPKRSFKAALSSMASAKGRFSIKAKSTNPEPQYA
jgi:hypothetical protein